MPRPKRLAWTTSRIRRIYSLHSRRLAAWSQHKTLFQTWDLLLHNPTSRHLLPPRILITLFHPTSFLLKNRNLMPTHRSKTRRNIHSSNRKFRRTLRQRLLSRSTRENRNRHLLENKFRFRIPNAIHILPPIFCNTFTFPFQNTTRTSFCSTTRHRYNTFTWNCSSHFS